MARALVRAGVGLWLAASASTVWQKYSADISNQWLARRAGANRGAAKHAAAHGVQVELDRRLNLAPCLRVELYSAQRQQAVGAHPHRYALR